MQLGIFAKTFPRPSLDQTLDAVVAHGLTHIQFNMSCMGLATLPDKLDEGSCVWIAQMLAQRGLRMAAISGTFNMVDPDAGRLAQHLRRLDALAAACRWLDTRIITLCTGSLDPQDMWTWHPENSLKNTWERLVETMRAAVKIADRHEVTLAFEPEINNVVSSVMRARRLLDEVGSPWLKVVIDPANLFYPGDLDRVRGRPVPMYVRLIGESASTTEETRLQEAFDWLGQDIVLAHAKNPFDIERTIDFMEWQAEVQKRLNLGGGPRTWEETLTHALAMMNTCEGQSELQQKAYWRPFYHLYLTSLIKAGFQGALIIHGLEETAVEGRVSFLRKMLGSLSRKD